METGNPDSDAEMLIQRKQEEFRKIVEEHQTLHPEGGFSIAPGPDPIAQEAMIRLMLQNVEQSIAAQGDAGMSADDIAQMKQEVREQVTAFLARSRKSSPEG